MYKNRKGAILKDVDDKVVPKIVYHIQRKQDDGTAKYEKFTATELTLDNDVYRLQVAECGVNINYIKGCFDDTECIYPDVYPQCNKCQYYIDMFKHSERKR